MNLIGWALGKKQPPPPHQVEAADEKFERAMRLTDEVRETINEVRKDPFTAIALDLARAVFTGGADPALVADAYEARQEARIFLGDKGRDQ